MAIDRVYIVLTNFGPLKAFESYYDAKDYFDSWIDNLDYEKVSEDYVRDPMDKTKWVRLQDADLY